MPILNVSHVHRTLCVHSQCSRSSSRRCACCSVSMSSSTSMSVSVSVSWHNGQLVSTICKMLHLHLLCWALRTFLFLQRAIDLPFTLHRLMAAQTKVIRRQSRETVQIYRERKREQQVSVFCSQQCPTTTYPQQFKQPRQCLLLTLR